MLDAEQTLHDDIASFLRAGRCRATAPEAGADTGGSFWHTRPSITAAEMQLVAYLADQPLCAEAAACRLAREVGETCELLEALVGVGVLEHDGDRYATTIAARVYLQAYLQR